MKKRVLFIDRDGTLVQEPGDFQVDSFTKLKFVPGVFTYLGKIAAKGDFELVMVTNQDGLGTESFPAENFHPVQDFIIDTLAGEGIVFSEICVDGSFPHENSPMRKPSTGMLTKYITGDYDLAASYVIGDRETDVQLAANLGCRAIFLNNPNFEPTAGEGIIRVDGWEDVYREVSIGRRRATHRRSTKETDIEVEIDLDGSGKADIATGIDFFDHMLEQISRHGGIDLTIRAKGDLKVDEHHTIEDVAITLGEAFSAALEDKRGMERYGYCLPMDDCLAQVSIDFGGRNWCVWDAEFKREMIGGMPTEMFFHFFKSFTDKALCNLNIKAEGTNEHHKIEAIFKAFAKAVKMAVRRDTEHLVLPSTKGSL